MNFFEAALSQNRLFHSIIFYGSNIYIQYAAALELARRLNCAETGAEDCSCPNCRWIRENKHPEIMTISKIDNKPANDKTRTVISVQQTEMVQNAAFTPSDCKRVFIFCDADFKTPSNKEKEEYEEFKAAGYTPCQEEADGRIWIPAGINQLCFQEKSANSMLKSIEEPPAGVTFIFLTNNLNDLISTIVSRSQAFYAPDIRITKYDTAFLEGYFKNYPAFNPASCLDFAQTLLDYQHEKGLEPEYIIDSLQYYLMQILKANTQNKLLEAKLFKDIEKTEEAKKMLRAYVKEAAVYEHLGFFFAGRIKG